MASNTHDSIEWKPTGSPARVRRRLLGLGLVVAASILWIDGPVAAWFAGIRIDGDLRREMGFVQQFGAISSILGTIWLVVLLDRRGRARLWDLLLSLLLASLAALILKIMVGRPRPSLGEPGVFLGPFGAFPIQGVGVVHSWSPEMWRTAQLWSFPSSHTLSAVVLATYLSLVYPQIRSFAWTMACLVGLIRISLAAHYVSDVVAGGVLGWAITRTVVAGAWVSRAGRVT